MDYERLKFLTKVNQSSGRKVNDLSECWLWKLKLNKDGYGQYQTDFAKERGLNYAHQAAYYLFKDQTYKPDRQTPLSHLCETTDVGSHRACVNPDHLTLATIQENIALRDQNLGNYQAKKTAGLKSGSSKLDKDKYNKIIELRKAGKMYKEIAEEFGLNRRTVERICLGKTYKNEFASQT